MLKKTFLPSLFILLAATGIRAELKFSEWQQDKQGSTQLGGNETSLSITPDGRNLYAAGRIENAVVVFDRDTSTGTVSLNSIAREGEGGMTGLKRPASVAVSPNGRFVYVAAPGSSSITVFDRKADGGMALNRTYAFSQVEFAGLKSPHKIYLHPAGNLMLVYTENAIKPRPIEIDTATGLFTTDYRDYDFAWESLQSDAALCFSESGQYYFSVERRDGRVRVNNSDPEMVTEIGELRKSFIPESIANDPMRVAVSPDEKFIYVSMERSPAIVIAAKDETTWDFNYKDSILYGQAVKYVHPRAPMMLLSEDGGQMYVSHSDDADITVFSRNATTGGLTMRKKVPLFLEPGTVRPEGVLSMVTSRDGRNVYVLPHWSHNLQAFKRDPANGDLEPLVRLNVGKAGTEGLSRPAGLVMAPDGKRLYSLPGNSDAVAFFDRDPQTGHLAWSGTSKMEIDPLAYSTYGDGAQPERGAVISPDGRHLYEGRPFEFALSAYAVDGDGSVARTQYIGTRTSGEAHMYGDAYLTGDGKMLFVGDTRDTALSSWTRDPATGLLAFHQLYQKGSRAMAGRNCMIGGKTDRFVYLGSVSDNTVGVRSRDETERLEWVQDERHHLAESRHSEPYAFMALSPDEKHLYKANRSGEVVQVFERDTATGRLHFRETLSPDTSQTKGMGGIMGMAMSPDGSALYLLAGFGQALTVLEREPVSGTLSYLKSFFNGEAGVEGLVDAGTLVVSPEGRHVYVGSLTNNSVAIFQNDAIAPAGLQGRQGSTASGKAIQVSLRGHRLLLQGLEAGAVEVDILDLQGRKVMAVAGVADASGRAELESAAVSKRSLFIVQMRQGRLTQRRMLFWERE